MLCCWMDRKMYSYFNCVAHDTHTQYTHINGNLGENNFDFCSRPAARRYFGLFQRELAIFDKISIRNIKRIS